MPEPIIKLKANDFEEAMDFLNLIFGASRPHDFAKMLPAIYQPKDENMGWNCAIRRNGRIRAMTGLFPMELRLGDSTLRMGGIGGVSSHPNERGAGHMTELMNHCVAKMRAEGHDLSWLSGLRQRYGRFGYEICGTRIAVHVNKTNLRHALPGKECAVRFEPLQSDDTESIRQALRLHDARLVRAVRTVDNFHQKAISWHKHPHAALDKSGKLVGYLVSNKEGSGVDEFVAETPAVAVDMAHAWVSQIEPNGSIFHISPGSLDIIRELGVFAEKIEINHGGSWLIFNWERVLDAAMKTRARLITMRDGALNLGVKEFGVYRLEAANGQAACRACAEKPDIECDASTAMRLLFGPLWPETLKDQPLENARAGSDAGFLLRSWLPLPLHLPYQDGL